MPASTQRSKRPIILLVTPHQIENKFLTQKHLPSINARIKVRRKQDEPPLELNAIISNPFVVDRPMTAMQTWSRGLDIRFSNYAQLPPHVGDTLALRGATEAHMFNN